MTQALNLANFANNLNTSGQLNGTAVIGTVPASTNAANLITTNFSIKQVGAKLYFYYGTTVIASMDSSGNLVGIANITAYGTP